MTGVILGSAESGTKVAARWDADVEVQSIHMHGYHYCDGCHCCVLIGVETEKRVVGSLT
jgi:hypothetical protein